MSKHDDPNRVEVGKLVLLDRVSAPEIYADGVTQVVGGIPCSRVILHSLVEPAHGDSKEVRRAVATLVMPTAALLESALRIATTLKDAQPLLASGIEKHSAALLKLLEQAQASQTGRGEMLWERKSDGNT